MSLLRKMCLLWKLILLWKMSLLNVTAVEIELHELVGPAGEIEPAVLISAGTFSTFLNFYIQAQFPHP